MDYIYNGNAQGDVASRLMQADFNVGALRPYIGKDGRTKISINEGGETKVITTNASATLRRDDWILIDEAIVKAAKPRLQAVADLRTRGLEYTIPNGMGKTVLETNTQSDITPASVNMDGLTQGAADRPQFDITNLPLPILHKDFHFSARQIAASRNGGSPLDTTTAELAARRVAELAEEMLIGTHGEYKFGGGSIYGYKNFPDRLTKTITSPEASGWKPATTVQEVLAMKNQSQKAYHYGPYQLYCSPDWDMYMDDDYSENKGSNTLRQRLGDIGGIQSISTLDYLSDFDLILVQMTSDVAREVIGMDLTTVQWETQGGMQINFKVMAIMVPQLRSDHYGKTGIVHGSV